MNPCFYRPNFPIYYLWALKVSLSHGYQNPTHNLTEVVDAIIALIGKPILPRSPQKLQNAQQPVSLNLNPHNHWGTSEHIKGPDFPTAVLFMIGVKLLMLTLPAKERLLSVLKLKLRSQKRRYAIIVSELPYQVNKSLLVRYRQLVRDKSWKVSLIWEMNLTAEA